jgi:hypothetical protein
LARGPRLHPGADAGDRLDISPPVDEIAPLPDEKSAPVTATAGEDMPIRRGDQHEFSFDLDEPLPSVSPGKSTAPPAQSPPSEQLAPEDSGIDFETIGEEIVPDDLEAPAPETTQDLPADVSLPTHLPADEDITLASPADETSEAAAFIEEHSAESDSAETLAHELAFDDIPVLQDVVTPPPAEGRSGDDSAPAIDPQKLRELSIRTVARLNIELRKRGESPLDARLIDRLQRLLREELEKSNKDG